MRQILATLVVFIAALTAFTVLGVHILDRGGTTADLRVLGLIVAGLIQRFMLMSRRRPGGRDSPRLSE